MARSQPPDEKRSATSEESDRTGPPEKVAVALSYKPQSADTAPTVSASGRGYLAERIIELAEEMDIPIRADSDLVEILAATEVGEEIPVEAFIAVAEILRYVYALNGQQAPRFDED
ncbi:hypothetical protein HH303_17560 [Rhodospirillaceae bacterium KN72]|uniref:Flagellar protein FhlB n=1 Tax=Pacificispira spongiicola TaxID=2729598 RepID=A0A7Y0E307_9PROT|nr:EscU/YscU/HrcU family type III secretion system export apparatus switch protein [Pacificispira spongiicola]NMM46302.1 hypothetical protein [Pacificispira spongiicola]